jgi:hypothetical protein
MYSDGGQDEQKEITRTGNEIIIPDDNKQAGF